MFHELPQAFRQRLNAWIRETRWISNEHRVAEAIGDFFEFYEAYLLIGDRPDLLASLMLESVRQGHGDD